MTKRRMRDKSRTLQHCRVTELVDVSDFDSDDESHGGSSPSSVAIMPHIPSYGGDQLLGFTTWVCPLVDQTKR